MNSRTRQIGAVCLAVLAWVLSPAGAQQAGPAAKARPASATASQNMAPAEETMSRVDESEMPMVADASDAAPKRSAGGTGSKNAKAPSETMRAAPSRGDREGVMQASAGRVAPAAPAVMAGLTQQYFPSGDRSSSAVLLERMGPAEVRRGEPFTYEIKVTNLTGQALTEVQLVERVAEGFELKGAHPEGGTGPNLKWSWDKLGPRETKTVAVSGTARAAGAIQSCADVTFHTEICSSIKVVEPALQLALTLPPEMILCEPIPMTLMVRNTGSGMARNVRVTATLPSGLTSDEALSFAVGDLGAGQMREMSATLKAAMKGSFNATANAVEDGGLSADATGSVQITKPELGLTKSGPDTRYIGRPAKYEITVTNNGDAPANDCVLTDELPSGTHLLETTAGGAVANNRVVWKLGTIAPGASSTVNVTLKPLAKGIVKNTVEARAFCGEAAAESTTKVVGVPAILLEVQDLEDPIEVGANTTYEIVVTNQGTAEGTNVAVVCTLPPELEFVNAVGPTAFSQAEKTITFGTLGKLPERTRATYRVTVKGTDVGDVRFKVSMTSDQSKVPVEETESTHVYK